MCVLLHACMLTTKQVIRSESYNYFKLIAKYWEKNKVCIVKGIAQSGIFAPMKTALEYGQDVQWFELFFHLCEKVDTTPTKLDFEEIFKHYRFENKSKECQALIKKKYKQFCLKS